MFWIICIVIGYFFGCIQSAYYVGKIFYKSDIRNFGSGNAGSTNAIRTFGFKAGIATFCLDILKTIIAYCLCTIIFKGNGTFFYYFYDGNGINVLPGLYAGVGVILGHNYPIQLRFKGGKGIACTVALILCMDIRIAVIVYIAAIIAIALTRFISIGSIIISILFIILTFVFDYPLEVKIISILLSTLSLIRHRSNIKKIVTGKENKFTFKKQLVDTVDSNTKESLNNNMH